MVMLFYVLYPNWSLFDSAQFRRDCHQQEVFPNVAFNKRRGMRRDDEVT